MATLEQRRAEVWGTAGERLCSPMAEAVENIAALVEVGDYEASLELLKITGLYRGVVNAVGEQDPEKIVNRQAEAQVQREGIPKDAAHEMLIDMTTGSTDTHRLEEIEAELWAEYGEEDRGRLPQSDRSRCCLFVLESC